MGFCAPLTLVSHFPWQDDEWELHHQERRLVCNLGRSHMLGFGGWARVFLTFLYVLGCFPFFFLDGTGVWTQGLKLARQMFYCFSHASSPLWTLSAVVWSVSCPWICSGWQAEEVGQHNGENLGTGHESELSSHLAAVWPGADDLTPLHLHFICK
jgi:hypothetical protein